MSLPPQDRDLCRDVTHALAEVSAGVPQADTRLLELVYGELKRLAAAKMAAQEARHTLQPTALVHEAYLRLLGGKVDASAFRGSAHFFSAAAAAMRSILVDHVRRKRAQKRGSGAVQVTLHPDVAELAAGGEPLGHVLAVHEALGSLAREHPRPAKVVELLFFAGLTAEEAAGVLGVSDRTVKRDWRFARAWLRRAMEGQ